jgi:hypothetical protein
MRARSVVWSDASVAVCRAFRFFAIKVEKAVGWLVLGEDVKLATYNYNQKSLM